METIRRNLGIRTMKNIESSNHIVKSLVVAFTLTGKKTRSQDCNVARRVLAESIAGIILGAKFSPWAIFRGFSPKKDLPFCIF